MSSEFMSAMKELMGRPTKEQCESVYEGMSSDYKKWVSLDVFSSFAMSNRESILWHDYEAGGTDSITTQPLQFAAIRTTLDHEIVDTPIDWYCKPAGDKLPHPVAISITGISPLKCEEQGMPEPLFFRKILREMSYAKTCTTGQNSMGYDENITRFGFWRNLLPVYKREFEFGNSRWDMLNVLAAFSMFEIPGINWPTFEDRRSLKLELFAAANNITQENAHNAVDDVKALIDTSRLLKSKSPELWNYLYEHRKKKDLYNFTSKDKVFVRASSLAGADNNYTTVGMIIGNMPGDKNKFVYIDLGKIQELKTCWKLTPEEIKRRLFLSKDELEAEGVPRPPLGVIAINKAPALFELDHARQYKPDIVSSEMLTAAEKLAPLSEFKGALCAAYLRDDEEDDQDSGYAESKLYSAGFPSRSDEGLLGYLSSKSLSDFFESETKWDGKLYPDLFWVAKCKLDGYDGIQLSDKERAKWNAYRRKKLVIEQESKKHEYVNLNNVRAVLADTEMDDALRKDYETWLERLESSINQEKTS